MVDGKSKVWTRWISLGVDKEMTKENSHIIPVERSYLRKDCIDINVSTL